MAREFMESADDQPITPHAAPTINVDGNLTYSGDDGRRYVVGLPPEADEESVERVMVTLRGGSNLFHQIEQLSRRWVTEVSGQDLDARAALVLLLTSLETALEDSCPEHSSDL